MTNREIASQLFISERTAEGHVEQIRNKLGFTSRSQVAAWAAQNLSSASAPITSPAPGPVAATAQAHAQAPAVTSRPLAARPASVRWPFGVTGLIVAVLLAAALLAVGLALINWASPTPGSLVITTYAGTGIRGSGGDGLTALKAELSHPSGIATDPVSGKVYFIDGNRVRGVRQDGTIRTVAGTGRSGPLPQDGISALSANLGLNEAYLGDVAQGLATDRQGNVYISDIGNHVVWKLTASGETFTISRFAGNGTAGVGGDGQAAPSAELMQPSGLALDSRGDLFIADAAAGTVRKVDSSTHLISTLAGAEAQLSGPHGMAVDAQDNLYVADSSNHRIVKISPDGALSKFPTVSALNSPFAVAIDHHDNLFVADGNHILRIDIEGGITNYAGNGAPGFNGDDVLPVNASLDTPLGVAVDAAGNIYVADTGNNRVRKIAMR